MPAWVFMSAMAMSLFAGCKWLALSDANGKGNGHDFRRTAGFLLAWTGMDARRFLSKTLAARPVGQREWFAPVLNCITGAALIWGMTRKAMPEFPLVAGWIGMIGMILLLHFGTFHLLSIAWRTYGVNAIPLMRSPMRSTSLADFWGRRWNTAFHDLTARFAFRPLQARVGPSNAMLLVFLLSGVIHELVISVPARGGYGLPTGYFLIQGLGMMAEHSRIGHRIGLGRGRLGWLFAMSVTALPAGFLFHTVFIRSVILPMLNAIGAF
jgi:hypothetical protein